MTVVRKRRKRQISPHVWQNLDNAGRVTSTTSRLGHDTTTRYEHGGGMRVTHSFGNSPFKDVEFINGRSHNGGKADVILSWVLITALRLIFQAVFGLAKWIYGLLTPTEDIESLLKRGVGLVESGALDGGLECFNKAQRIDPTSGAALLGKSYISYLRGHYDSGLALARLVQSDDPDIRREAMHVSARCNTELKAYMDAVSDYTSAISIKEDDYSAYFHRGMLFDALHCYSDALQDLRMFKQIRPASSDADEALERIGNILL